MAAAPKTFVPPFCPNPTCNFHLNPMGWSFRKAGFYERMCSPRVVQRYCCSHCRRYFSEQTFSVTYWLKRPELLVNVFEAILSGTGLRQLARFRACSPSTVMHHVARLGRHCLLAHQYLRPKHAPRAVTVVDGFESFEYSQYFPLHVNIAVDARAHFIYAFTDAPLRRKGRTTARQKRKRAQLEAQHGRPDPKAIEKAVAELVRLFAPEGSDVTIHSDEHPAYRRAFRRVSAVEITHRTTHSKAARTAGNPLFPVNRVDLWTRHNGANHKRETIAYSKRRQAVMERFAILAVWLNYMKSFSEKKRDASPGERLGVTHQRLDVPKLLSRRLFPSQIRLPDVWQGYYDRVVETVCIPNGKRHDLTYAY
jgi:transposase-like protein